MLRRATHHSAVIQWQHPPPSPDPILSFRFRYTTSEDSSQDVEEVHDVNPTISQFTVLGLKPGNAYIFQVRAANKYGLGIWSESSLSIRTLDGHVPSKITELCVPHMYRSFITLRWPTPEENGYELTKYVLRMANQPDMS